MDDPQMIHMHHAVFVKVVQFSLVVFALYAMLCWTSSSTDIGLRDGGYFNSVNQFPHKQNFRSCKSTYWII